MTAIEIIKKNWHFSPLVQKYGQVSQSKSLWAKVATRKSSSYSCAYLHKIKRNSAVNQPSTISF